MPWRLTLGGDLYLDSTAAVTGAETANISFINGDLVAGVLTWMHNLGGDLTGVVIKNNNGNHVTPDELTETDANTLTIDLSSYGAITGTWEASATA